MTKRDCLPCSTEVNQYESDWLESLIQWLDSVTCIGWMQVNQAISQPELTADRDKQYGTVSINSIKYLTSIKTETVHRTDNEVCVRLNHIIEADIDLRVYNHVKMLVSNGQRLKTSADSLLRILDVYYGLPRLANLLKGKGMQFSDFGQINNIIEERQSTFVKSSSLNTILRVSRATSFADNIFVGFSLDMGCNNSNCE